MTVTQHYKIDHATMDAALFALRVRVLNITQTLSVETDEESRTYWTKELARANAAIAVLEAL